MKKVLLAVVVTAAQVALGGLRDDFAMPVVVLQSAKNDLRDSYLFYERQGGAYLGNYFLVCPLKMLGDFSIIYPPNRKNA